MYCERVKGATLVSLDDKEEEEYVKNKMKSIGVEIFHNATQSSLRFVQYAFMCEYELGKMHRIAWAMDFTFTKII